MTWNVEQIQMVLFYSSLDLSSKLKLATRLSEDLTVFSQAEPLFIPLPNDAPPEIPLLQLSNDIDGWILGLSAQRCDIIFRSKSDMFDFDSFLSVAEDVLHSTWRILTNEFDAKSQRLAVVATLSVKSDQPAETIAGSYFKVSLSDNTMETQIHYREVFNLDDFSVNRWVRIISLVQPPEVPRIILLIDVNTVQEQPLEVNEHSISTFTATSFRLFGEAIEQHRKLLER